MTIQDLLARQLLVLVDTWTNDTVTLNLYSPAPGEETNPLLANYRGIITDEHDTVVMPNLPMPDEMIVGVDPEPQFEWPITCRIAYEGTLLRMFRYADRTFISTNKRIDAGTSTWATRKSFLSYFKDIVGQEYEASSEYSLIFLLPTRDENKIGSLRDPSEPVLFLVGVYCSPDRGILIKDELQQWIASTGLVLPNYVRFPEVLTISSYGHLRFSVDQLTDDPTFNQIGVSCPGVIYKNMRFVSFTYAERVRIRGNTPNLKLRYYELRANGTQYDMDAFVALYAFDKDGAEAEIQAVVDFIFRGYKARFINKQYIVLPKRLFQVVSTCHARYQTLHQPIQQSTVRAAVDALSPADLLLLTRDYRQAIQRSKDVLQLLH